MTLFKAAFTFRDDPENPYLIQVAIPIGPDNFITHDFPFGSHTSAMLLLSAYLEEYRKRPDSILEFHRKKVVELQSNMELPFSKK